MFVLGHFSYLLTGDPWDTPLWPLNTERRLLISASKILRYSCTSAQFPAPVSLSLASLSSPLCLALWPPEVLTLPPTFSPFCGFWSSTASCSLRSQPSHHFLRGAFLDFSNWVQFTSFHFSCIHFRTLFHVHYNFVYTCGILPTFDFSKL